MSAPNKLFLINQLLQEFRSRAFSGIMRTYGPHVKVVLPLDPRQGLVRFAYKVPAALCVPSSSKQPAYLPAGACLAILDELSTYSFMLKDKNSRAGVSVFLSLDMLCAGQAMIRPDDDIEVVITNDKLGKMLGFCTMEIHGAGRKVLARGQHIKYMPQGFAVELLLGPLLPLFVMLYKYFNGAQFLFKKKIPFLEKYTDEQDSGGKGVGAAYQEVISVKEHSSTADRYVGLLQVPRHFENPLGITHGGSVAMSIQQTASQMHTKRRKADEGDSYLRRVEIRYLSGLKKGDVLIAVDSEQGGSRMSGTVASAAAPAVPSSQFDLEWARF